jgi:hypothetical protein
MVQTITNSVIDHGEVIGKLEMIELFDGSNPVTAMAWTIKQ